MNMIKEGIFCGKFMYHLCFGELKLWVSPEDGMTIYQLEYGERVVVRYNEERCKLNMTHGIPILYPTPNRTKNMSYDFNGITHHTKTHGFAKSQVFEVVNFGEESDKVFIEGRFVINKDDYIYSLFPYISDLTIRIEVKENSLHYRYEVHNKGDKPLPYGFGVHPFFEKNKEDVNITVKANKVMEMTEEKLPTGILIDVSQSDMDMRSGRNIRDLSIDHVFTEIEYSPNAIINYNDLQIELDSTRDFSHMVVYTPDMNFFCIENQTCSTDSVNLYNMGFVKESGLNIVNPKEKAAGEIVFSFHRK